MPRGRRFLVDGHPHHVLNRGNRKQTIFYKPEDYRAFISILEEAQDRFEMPICGLCLMRNHFHLVLWPQYGRSISEYMHWVLGTHVHRYNLHYGLSGQGHVYQDRFKAFPIQDSDHLRTVMRYVEGNPLRASLVNSADQWAWSSLTLRTRPVWQELLADDRLTFPDNWIEIVNGPIPAEELQEVQLCARRGVPFGDPAWVKQTTKKNQKRKRGQDP